MQCSLREWDFNAISIKSIIYNLVLCKASEIHIRIAAPPIINICQLGIDSGNDELKGGPGDDYISGGSGKDTSIYSGKSSD